MKTGAHLNQKHARRIYLLVHLLRFPSLLIAPQPAHCNLPWFGNGCEHNYKVEFLKTQVKQLLCTCCKYNYKLKVPKTQAKDQLCSLALNCVVRFQCDKKFVLSDSIVPNHHFVVKSHFVPRLDFKNLNQGTGRCGGAGGCTTSPALYQRPGAYGGVPEKNCVRKVFCACTYLGGG